MDYTTMSTEELQALATSMSEDPTTYMPEINKINFELESRDAWRIPIQVSKMPVIVL